MAPSFSSPYAAAFSLLLTITTLFTSGAHGLTQKYCSNQNTGTTKDGVFWKYQSNGWCHDKCVDQYAFAVIQGSFCWCSDYVPANQLDISECSDICPGFGEERCGNEADGLYGYITLEKVPSGTASGSGSPWAPSTFLSPTFFPPSPSEAFPSGVVAESSVQTLEETTPTRVSSVSSDPTQTAPITSVQVITESGAEVTKVVTIMPPAADNQMSSTKKETSGGVIAGAVIGSLAGLAGIVGILVWALAYRRRRNKDEDDGDYETGDKASGSPQRHASTLSKAGLLNSEKAYPTIAIPGPTRHSSNGTDGISPVSGSLGSERRNSRPLFYDQRLNPSALMDLDNGSHTSILTMEDNKDYTRTLNVRNPDQ